MSQIWLRKLLPSYFKTTPNSWNVVRTSSSRIQNETIVPDANRIELSGIGSKTSYRSNAKPSRPAWVVTVLTGLCILSVVLCINIGMLVWVYSHRNESRDGITPVRNGLCRDMEFAIGGVELVINVLSTLMFAASNTCSQVLVSPTRREVDRAHVKGKWVHVGIAAFRNIPYIDRWRTFLWICLIASSVPLHLFYNSVFFLSSYASDYIATAVTEDFIVGGPWNEALALEIFSIHRGPDEGEGQPPYLTRLHGIQNSIANMTRLNNQDCQAAFNTSQVTSVYSSVVLVTNYNQSNSMVNGIFRAPEWGGQASWFTGTESVSEREDTTGSTKVSHECLDWEFGRGETVVVCNAVKMACLIVTLFRLHANPFVTVGDAISSFLEEPDPTTRSSGPLCLDDMYKPLSKARKRGRWPCKQFTWFTAVKSPLVECSLLFIPIPWIGGLCYLISLWATNQAGSWSHDATFADLKHHNNVSLTAFALLVNTPQLAVSFFYVFYNNFITRMAVAGEYNGFARRRRGLRVSRPIGQQCSTYWLQLPYRLALPMMALISLLHWILSRGIYLINVNVHDIDGELVPARVYASFGTSALGLTLGFSVATLMILVMIIVMQRKLDTSMPVLGTCSLAISAACHAPEWDNDAATKLLSYGVVPDSVEGEEEELLEPSEGKRHVSFSSGPVSPLVKGGLYS